MKVDSGRVLIGKLEMDIVRIPVSVSTTGAE